MNKRIFVSIFLVMLMVLVIGCSEDNENKESESDNTNEENTSNDNEDQATGGQLNIGISAQPPTLDPHISSATAMSDVTKSMYETLLTLNSEGEIVPQLAESFDVSEDGKTYTFQLRQGVLFHNGKEMKAEDVVASMNRWTKESISVPNFLKAGEFVEVDEYVVELQLPNPSALTLPVLSKDRYYGAIIPKEVVEGADETGITEHIGTGPFQFVEWKQDQYIHQTKFEDYQPVDAPADGMSGKKEALVDDIYFNFVPDSSTQVAGILSGEYDIVLGIPGSYYDQLVNNPDVDTHVKVSGHSVVFFNKNEGWFEDERMRQAVNAAIDVEAILLGGFGNEELYEINSSYEHGIWESEEGSEFYNEKDLDKAKRLLEEAGYNGEPIVFVTTRDYEEHYNQAIVIQEQLEKVGINMEIEVYDWPTRNEKLNDPSIWDMSLTGATTKATPIEHIYLNQEYVNGPEDEKTNELIDDMSNAKTLEEAKAIWDELQGYLWEYLTAIKLGDTMDVSVTSKNVEGFGYLGGPLLWNTSNNK
ncbi:ABC transporter substrate-binding protein [Ornithinibacillus sp. 4-3]|uniref:ABC transporter substrate-binding protein n=1 Tax=Ornithinibacillus sp. 4-3 TaxID=3231488 RepID=A0AB39HJW9_9BACI